MSHYRDPLAGLQSQVATKRAVIESRAHEVSPMVLALLPESLTRKLEELAPRAFAAAETMESLAAADAALDALLEAYDAALAKAPSLRISDDQVTDPAPPRMPPPWLYEEPFLRALRDAMDARVRSVDGEARVSRHGDHAYVARFRVGGPFSFVIAVAMTNAQPVFTSYECFLRTSVPEALPSLQLRREGARHAVGRALHLAHEIAVGDVAFDAQFWIQGSARTTAVLTPSVRAALGRLAPRSPVLHVGDAMATLSWTGTGGSSTQHLLPVAALDVLVGIRDAIERG